MYIGFIEYSKEHPEIYIFQKKSLKYSIYQIIEFQHGTGHMPIIEPLTIKVQTFYLSLPIEYLNFRIMETPFADKEKVLSTAPYELQGMLAKPAVYHIFDALVVGSVGERFKVLIVYIEKDMLRDIIAGFKGVKMEPMVISCAELRFKLANYPLDDMFSSFDKTNINWQDIIVDELKSPIINLRRNEFSYTKYFDEAKKRLKSAFVLTVLILLSISVYMGIKITIIKDRTAAITTKMVTSYKILFKDSTNVSSPLYQLKGKVKELTQKEAIIKTNSVLNLMLQLVGVGDSGVIVDELEIDDAKAVIKGSADTMENIEAVKTILMKSFTKVDILETKNTGQLNSIRFVLQMNYAEK
ncbi:MAG: hypothetical protein L3V56_08940 [Candidatus Magnetoovum sp. WYHC-5]|nr:hypothetical protein [Candidatus Magnetoovum sp. WYHC-5]